MCKKISRCSILEIHRSFFDILLTYSRCPRLTGYVAKKEMEKIPLLSTWMRYLHCLFLDRDNIKEGLKPSDRNRKDQIRYSICIFPEGTRNRGRMNWKLLPFHEGSFKLATKSGCPIIPIAMNNTAEIFELISPGSRKQKSCWSTALPSIRISFFKEDQKKLGQYVQRQILEMMKKNQKLISEV